ncbi:MAG: beta-N-acetylhexosaminidase [Chloroflexi bacterium]|nr:beta-N-acetylhexosaminidase [Chloroflexota bacterium]
MDSIEHQMGQRLVVGFHGLTAPDYLLEWLDAGRVGGVILFQRNVDSPEQLAALTRSLHAAARMPLLIGIDQEGGEVARLRGRFTEAPSAMALAAGGGQYAEAVAGVLAEEMRALGINWNFAPVLDISHNAANPSLGTRSPGAYPRLVGEIAAAQVVGYQAARVAACAKHFPGLGDTDIDTHVALPSIDTPLDGLIDTDLMPYRAVIEAGVASIMTTHTIFAALDPALPATLSPSIVPALLRQTLGFDGVVTTDCLEMGAITAHHSPAESAALAAAAGVDLILFSHTREVQEEAYRGLVEAARSGRVSEENRTESLRRIQAMKGAYAITEPPRPESIRTEPHVETMISASKAGVQLVRAQGVVPLPEHVSVALVEFPSIHDSDVFDATGHTGLATRLLARRPDATVVALSPSLLDEDMEEALSAARRAGVTILATRSIHLSPEHIRLAAAVLSAAHISVLVALRNPYDVGVLPEADAALCSFGGAEPQLDAVVGALFGDFVPTGSAPVALGG